MTRDYNDPAYRAARKMVLKRDGHECQMPNCGKKTTLQVHHIQPWARATYLRFEPTNLITLCKEHHKEVTGKEHLYVSLFTALARKNRRSK